MMSPLKGNAFALTYILGLQPYRELAREGSRYGGPQAYLKGLEPAYVCPHRKGSHGIQASLYLSDT